MYKYIHALILMLKRNNRDKKEAKMISTTYAMRKGYKPIDFFYRSVVDVKTKKVKFVDAFQILNDRYVGRMNVMNYFFIAENSVRINELNLIALDELKNYNQVMRENFYIPDVVYYQFPVKFAFCVLMTWLCYKTEFTRRIFGVKNSFGL